MSPYYPSQASLLVAAQSSSYPVEYGVGQTTSGSAVDYANLGAQPLYAHHHNHHHHHNHNNNHHHHLNGNGNNAGNPHQNPGVNSLADLSGAVGVEQKANVVGFGGSSSMLHHSSSSHYAFQPTYAHSAVYPRYPPFDRLDGAPNASQMYGMSAPNASTNGLGGGVPAGNSSLLLVGSGGTTPPNSSAVANGNAMNGTQPPPGNNGTSGSLNAPNNQMHSHLSHSHLNGNQLSHPSLHSLSHSSGASLNGALTGSAPAPASSSASSSSSSAHSTVVTHPSTGNGSIPTSAANGGTLNNQLGLSNNNNISTIHGSPSTPVGNHSLASSSSARSSPLSHMSMAMHSNNGNNTQTPLQNSASNGQLHSLDSSPYFAQLTTAALNGSSAPDRSPAHSQSSGSIHTPPHSGLQLSKNDSLLGSSGASLHCVTSGSSALSALNAPTALSHHSHHQLSQLNPLAAAAAAAAAASGPGSAPSSHHLLGTSGLSHHQLVHHGNGSSALNAHHASYLNCSSTPPIGPSDLAYGMPAGMCSPPLSSASNNGKVFVRDLCLAIPFA
jgi:hypothetical protein